MNKVSFIHEFKTFCAIRGRKHFGVCCYWKRCVLFLTFRALCNTECLVRHSYCPMDSSSTINTIVFCNKTQMKHLLVRVLRFMPINVFCMEMLDIFLLKAFSFKQQETETSSWKSLRAFYGRCVLRMMC